MDCGCNEIAQSSQARIAEAMSRLLEKKPFSSVSISELCREAGVSRPTFYSQFASTDDVIRFILQASYCYTPEADHSDTCGLNSLCKGYSGYIVSHRDFLSLLMKNGLFHVLYQSIKDSLTACDCFLSDTDPELRRYAAHFTAGGLAGFIQNYTEGGFCSEDSMSDLLRQLFSGQFFLDTF